MLFCRLIASGIGTITANLRYGIAGAYKCLWPGKGCVKLRSDDFQLSFIYPMKKSMKLNNL